MEDRSVSRRDFLRGRVLGALWRPETRAEGPERRPPTQRVVLPADPTPPPGATAPGKALPDLNQALLDEPTLEQLFSDYLHCTEVLEVVPKMAGQQRAERGMVDLVEGRRLLDQGRARALQVRYRYEGAEWWDTLIATPTGIRLVRIRHEFPSQLPGGVVG